MLPRPLLSKMLASKIRGAQKKVANARLNILVNEEKIQYCRAELDEFATDPAGFAKTHFGKYEVNSYPVVTRIARRKEELEYRLRKSQANLTDLVLAEESLVSIESDVMQELSVPRSNHKGRTPWPDSLPSMDEIRDEYQRERDRFEIALSVCEHENEIKAHLADKEIEAQHELEWRQLREVISSEERDLARKWFDHVKDALNTGEISLNDLLLQVKKKYLR